MGFNLAFKGLSASFKRKGLLNSYSAVCVCGVCGVCVCGVCVVCVVCVCVCVRSKGARINVVSGALLENIRDFLQFIQAMARWYFVI